MNILNAAYPSRSGNRKFRFWRGGRIGSVLLPALLLLAVSGESWAQGGTGVLSLREGTRADSDEITSVEEGFLDYVFVRVDFNPPLTAQTGVTFTIGQDGDTAARTTDYNRLGSLNDTGNISPFTYTDFTAAGGSRSVCYCGFRGFNLHIIDDPYAEDDEILTISATAGGYTIASATLTILASDPVVDPTGVELSLNEESVSEGESHSVTVTAKFLPENARKPSTETEVMISVAGGGTNPASSLDFIAGDFSVTIPANMNFGTATLDLMVTDDALVEEDETLTVSGTDLSASSVPVTPTMLKIESDDVAGVTITVTKGEIVKEVEGEVEVNVDEGDALEYTIVLDSDPGPGVTVEVIHASGAGTRSFTQFGGVFRNFFTSTGANSWDRPRVVSGRTPRDSDAVDDTVFQVHTVTGYAGVTDADVVNIKVNIIDDGTPGLRITPNPLTVFEGGTDPYQYTVSFRHVLVAPATVTPVVGASESAGIMVSPAFLNFTQANGNTNQTFTVTVADDSDASDATLIVGHTITGYPEFTDPTRAELTVNVVDDEESPTGVLLEIVPSTAVVAETDADAERTITLRASLSPADSGLLAAPTEVEIMVTGGGTNPATVGADATVPGADIIPAPLTITIPAGDRTMTEALTLTVVGDRVAEGTETVMVSGTAISDVTTLPVNSVTLQVLDDDSPTVTLSADPVSESVVGGTVTVTATADLALPGGFSVGVLITPGTATAGEDYTATGVARLTFDGDVGEEETFTVTILPDRVDEGAGETFTVSLISLRDNAVPVVISDTVEVTITDDDTAGVAISPNNLPLREGASGTYTIALNSDPAGSATVTIGSCPAHCRQIW